MAEYEAGTIKDLQSAPRRSVKSEMKWKSSGRSTENEKNFFAEDWSFGGEWSEEPKSEDWDFIAKN